MRIDDNYQFLLKRGVCNNAFLEMEKMFAVQNKTKKSLFSDGRTLETKKNRYSENRLNTINKRLNEEDLDFDYEKNKQKLLKYPNEVKKISAYLDPSKNEIPLTKRTGNLKRASRLYKSQPWAGASYSFKVKRSDIINASTNNLFSNHWTIYKTSEEIDKKLLELTNQAEKGGGEVVVKTITPDMITSIVYTPSNPKKISERLEAYNLWRIYKDFTGISLPIINYYDDKKIDPDQLKQEIDQELKDVKNKLNNITNDKLTELTELTNIYNDLANRRLIPLNAEDLTEIIPNAIKKSKYNDEDYKPQLEWNKSRGLLWAKEQREEVCNFYNNEAYKRTDLGAISESQTNHKTRLNYINEFIENKSYNPKLLAKQLQDNFLEEVKKSNKTFRESTLKSIQEIAEGVDGKKLSDVFPKSSRIKTIESKLDKYEIQEFAKKLYEACSAKNVSLNAR